MSQTPEEQDRLTRLETRQDAILKDLVEIRTDLKLVLTFMTQAAAARATLAAMGLTVAKIAAVAAAVVTVWSLVFRG